jgi:hypothetical protein
VNCHACGEKINAGLICACHFPTYRCQCGKVGAARTVTDPRAATAAFLTHYLRHHYKETP